jgi:two-component system, LytTR family, sensor kinase
MPEEKLKIMYTNPVIAMPVFLQHPEETPFRLGSHFLSNVLTGLYSSALRVDEGLAADILRVSHILSYSLRRQELVTLTEEVACLLDYLTLQEERYQPDFHLDFYINGLSIRKILKVQMEHFFPLLNGKTIPPMVLVSLVENALKHGQYRDKATPVKVNLEISERCIEFCTRNIKQKRVTVFDYPSGSEGFGISDLQERLSNSYRESASFTICEEENIFHTRLIINY